MAAVTTEKSIKNKIQNMTTEQKLDYLYHQYNTTNNELYFNFLWKILGGWIYKTASQYGLQREIDDVKQFVAHNLIKDWDRYDSEKGTVRTYFNLIINGAVKTYLSWKNRRKYEIHDNAASLNKTIKTDGVQQREQFEVIPGAPDVAESFAEREYYLELYRKLCKKLTYMEWRCFRAYLFAGSAGVKNSHFHGYFEIAQKLYGYERKQIDNAMQRVRKKAKKVAELYKQGKTSSNKY